MSPPQGPVSRLEETALSDHVLLLVDPDSWVQLCIKKEMVYLK